MTYSTAETSPATGADEELLASRPRVRRDVLYTEVPEGVLFHDATTGFRVHGRSAYRFATLVVPFLDGTTTVAELSAGLGPAQRAMVLDLVGTLYRRGFARAVPPVDPDREPVLAEPVRRRFEPQVSYIDHHVDDAESRFATFRHTRVAVVGDDEVAGWAARSLLRNGAATIGVAPLVLDDGLEREAAELSADDCPADLRAVAALAGSPTWPELDGYDVVVVTPTASGTRTVLALQEQGVPEGVVLLPCWTAGRDVLLGPSMRTGTRGCWLCAALRVAGTAEPEAAADLWSGLAGHRLPGHRPLGPVAAMVGNLVGYEIFRLTTGALPGETDGRVVVQDQDTLDAVVEPLLPHPACGLCSAPGPHLRAVGDRATELAEPAASPQAWKPMPEPGGPEAEQQLATLEQRMALVGARLGVVTAFDDDLLPQTPLRVTTAHVALGHGRRRRIAAVDVHNVAGARIAALAAAAGVYTDRLVPPDGLLTGAAAEEAQRLLPVVPPAALTTQSGTDPDGATVSAWVAATSLTTGGRALVPAAAVAPYADHNTGGAITPGPAGTGVDGSPAGARGAALLSALAHDALVDAVHGRRTATRLVLGERDDDPVLTFLVRTAGHLGVRPELLDLGPDGGAPVVLARTTPPGSDDDLWTVAADTTRRAATVTVLRDLLGRVQLAAALEGEPVDTGDPIVADLDTRTIAVSGERPWTDRAVTLPKVLDGLRARGVDPLVVDRRSADLDAAGLSVARVVLARTLEATAGEAADDD
jgi:bacteriocin biosynthesis cyclodehydratase domain-containing protein